MRYCRLFKKYVPVKLLGTRFEAIITLVNLVPRSITGPFFAASVTSMDTTN
jgi:hypothetical protein